MTRHAELAPDQLRLLDAIYSFPGPLDALQIHELVGQTGTLLTRQHIIDLLFDLERDNLVLRHDLATKGICYEISPLGKARVCASDARRAWNGRVPTEPVKEAVHAAATPPRTEAGSILHEQLKGSHAHIDRQAAAPVSVSLCNAQEPRVPDFATVCMNEDELDDWWSSLDVQQKASAFVEFSLETAPARKSAESHTHIHTHIHVAGTVGDLSKELCDKLRDDLSKTARI
jgi:hypothetical protein